MTLLRPFRAVRPPKSLALEIAAPPYDVVSTEEARALASGNARSFLHISRPEIDLPPGTDEHSEAVYAQGKRALETFLTNQWLQADDAIGFGVYRQRMGDHVQTGVVAVASVDGYRRGAIKKHELTRADKEDDRTRHIDVLGGNDEPVFLTYRARAAVDAIVAKVCGAAPELEFTSADGVEHAYWRANAGATAALEAALGQLDALYIADGHHRSAAAARVAALRHADGSAAPAWFLAVVFPHTEMKILPYNRLVKDLAGRDAQAFLVALGEKFEVTPDATPTPSQARDVSLYLGQRWWRLRARPGSWAATPLGELDVTVLQQNVLGPLLGIRDPRTDKRIDFVGGIRGTAELERRVNSGAFAAAFSMYPTTLEQLMAIADAGEIMPPKSTWFEPKLKSGLFLHLFTPEGGSTPGR